MLSVVAAVLLFAAVPQGPDGALTWLRKAEQFFEQHRWEQAGDAAAHALELDPRLAGAELLLGLVATARSDFAGAEEHFLRAVSLEPENFRAHTYLGSTYLQQRRLSDAARAFQKALQLDRGNATAHYNLGAIALAAGNATEALSHFEAVHRVDATDVPAALGILECQLLLQRAAEAGKTARRLDAALDPKDPRLTRVAALLALHGDYADAIPVLEKIHRASPASHETAYNLALAYSRSGQYDKAAETLRPLLRGSSAADAYNLLAFVEEKRHKLPEAIRAYQRAAELEPANEGYWFDYANALLQHQSVQAGLGAFISGAREFPKSWRMRLGLGSAYYLVGDYERAAQALLDAIAREPDSRLAYFLLGKAYESAHSVQAAIEERFRSYLLRRPNDPWAYYHYATMLYLRATSEGQSDFSRAKENLERALVLDPDLAPAYLQLGIIAQAEGRLEESLHLFERAVKLDPKLAAAHYRLALTYQRLEQRGKAQIEMGRFQALKAEDQIAPDRGTVLESLARQAR
jgi:tetratricopeptide (TPR) repeat protein